MPDPSAESESASDGATMRGLGTESPGHSAASPDNLPRSTGAWESAESYARVPARDPRRALVRLLARLEAGPRLVTRADLERAAARRPTRSLPAASIPDLLDAALADMLVLTDRRLFLDRATGTLDARWVYRVNRRHPLARDTLA